MKPAAHRIPLCVPFLGGREREYLSECVDSNWVSSVGPFVDQFEEKFAAFVGARYAVATCNGTAALHVALRLVGVQPGDEVMVSTLTFVASANVIRYLGATPVFIDSEPNTWNLDPALVASEVRRRASAGRLPKAILPVHVYGHPAHLAPILGVAAEYGIPVVEDAAESLGATCEGRHVGTLGQVGCFSFNGNKVITCGGGGMIVTDDSALAARAKHLTTQARLRGAEYRHDEVGYNYRLTNIQAALGVAQLEQLPSFLERKRAIAGRYASGLADLPGVTSVLEGPWARSSWWMYCVRLAAAEFGADRGQALCDLEAKGAQCRPIWTPLHTLPLYADRPRVGGAVAERLFNEGLSLPSSVGLTIEDQMAVIEALRECHERRTASSAVGPSHT